MSDADSLLFPASSDFIELCQAQTLLLTGALGAVWSAVYLTVESQADGTRQLLPIAIYPDRETDDRSRKILARLTESWSQGEDNNNLTEAVAREDRSKQTLASRRQLKPHARRKQVVLPLIYKDEVMGLLVTKRDDREWNRREVSQIEEIAKTIAISRTLDRTQEFYRHNLESLQHSIVKDRDKIDDLFHQLRNPLTALRTFGKLLLKRLLPEDRNRQMVQNIIEQGDRIQDLLQQFQGDSHKEVVESSHLALPSRSIYLEDAKENSNFLLPAHFPIDESIDLLEILEPLIDVASAIAQEKEIALTVALPPHIPLIRGERKALREVFSNLIDNAVKYTPRGGSVEIEAGLTEEKDGNSYLGVTIGDTGCGIPIEDRQHLFERNYRGVQAQGNIEGTGLGLAIAKELIEKLDGEIEVISPNPRAVDSNAIGTVFTVWLKTA